jgi:hypothetical protein
MAKCAECVVRRVRRGERICDGCASKGLDVPLLKLYGKALRQLSGSPRQREIDQQIAARLAELKRSA